MKSQELEVIHPGYLDGSLEAQVLVKTVRSKLAPSKVTAIRQAQQKARPVPAEWVWPARQEVSTVSIEEKKLRKLLRQTRSTAKRYRLITLGMVSLFTAIQVCCVVYISRQGSNASGITQQTSPKLAQLEDKVSKLATVAGFLMERSLEH